MTEERKKILEMLASGKISVSEAEKLLSAIDTSETKSKASESTLSTKAKYLYVNVESSKAGGDQVNIKVPFQLIRAGAKLAAFIPINVQDKVSSEMQKHGLNFKLNELNSNNLEEIVSALSEMQIDVVNDHERVRVYCQ